MKWHCGFRKDFRLWFDRDYYDGEWYCLNLGWFWITVGPR